MKNIFRKILPCVFVVLVVVTLASCKSKYKYPKVIPGVSEADQTYFQIGNYTINNKNAYHRMLKTYGLASIQEMIDSVMLKNQAYDEEEFQRQMNLYIYGVEDLSELEQDEIDEYYNEFIKAMTTQGLLTKADWEAYYLLEYKRLMYAIDQLKLDIKEYDEKAAADGTDPYFKESDYETYYNNNYHKDLDLIILTFDSELEAKAMMAQHGIDTNKLLGPWEDGAGNLLMEAEILNAFLNMATVINNGDPVIGATTYTYAELNKISSTISTKAYELEASGSKSYTHGPIAYGSRLYMVLKTGESQLADFEDISEETRTEIYEAMVENACTSAYIAKELMEARNNINLKIYDEGLEIAYTTSYNKNYSTLAITDYTAYKTTTDESNTNLVTYSYNGTNYTITADDLFNFMDNRYGVLFGLLLVQQYVILNNRDYNNVYDYLTDTILDKTTYDDYYADDVKAYKKAFENNEYAASGYPKKYGWENFLRDYLGVMSEKELLISIDGSLYSASEALFKEALYMGEEVTEIDENGDTVVVKTADQAVQDEMTRIFTEYFSASVIGVYAYYDADLNGIADEIEAESVEEAMALELVNLIYAKAKDSDKETLASRLNDVVLRYKLATRSDAVWGQYKQIGLRVAILSTTTYSNSSTADENLLDAVHEIWDDILAYKNTENGVEIAGQSLDPGYRYSKSSVAYYVTAEQFADGKSAFVANNSAYRIAITNATNHTYITSSTGLYKPTLAEYLNYLKPDDDKSKTTVSSALKNAITTYYIPAINNLTTDAIVNDNLMEDCLALMNNFSWTKNNDKKKETARIIILNNMTEETREIYED